MNKESIVIIILMAIFVLQPKITFLTNDLMGYIGTFIMSLVLLILGMNYFDNKVLFGLLFSLIIMDGYVTAPETMGARRKEDSFYGGYDSIEGFEDNNSDSEDDSDSDDDDDDKPNEEFEGEEDQDNQDENTEKFDKINPDGNEDDQDKNEDEDESFTSKIVKNRSTNRKYSNEIVNHAKNVDKNIQKLDKALSAFGHRLK